jgi:uncharacterized glyoxalase superfamily protein PhnB
VFHCELKIGTAVFMLADEFPEIDRQNEEPMTDASYTVDDQFVGK